MELPPELLELAASAPGLFGVVLVVFFFLRHQKGQREMEAQSRGEFLAKLDSIEKRHHQACDVTIDVVKDNTRALGEVNSTLADVRRTLDKIA